MKTWQKVTLILGGSLVLSGVALGVLGYQFLWKNRDAVIAKITEAVERGRAFGAGKPYTACVDEALRQVAGDPGFQEEALIRTSLTACLEVATADSSCDGVPPTSELMRSTTWAIELCQAHAPRAAQACARVIRELQKHCEGK